MADFLLRDIDERVAERIKEMARQRGWPLNDVILHLIKLALGLSEPEPAPVPGDIARVGLGQLRTLLASLRAAMSSPKCPS